MNYHDGIATELGLKSYSFLKLISCNEKYEKEQIWTSISRLTVLVVDQAVGSGRARAARAICIEGSESRRPLAPPIAYGLN